MVTGVLILAINSQVSRRLENIIPISSATSFVKFVRLTQVNLTQGISGGNLTYDNQNIRHLKGWESKLRTDTQHFYGTYRHYIFIYSSDFWKKKKSYFKLLPGSVADISDPKNKQSVKWNSHAFNWPMCTMAFTKPYIIKL